MTYSLWQSDERIYSLGGRVRNRPDGKETPEQPRDWTEADMERVERLMEKAARQRAIRAAHLNRRDSVA